MSRLRRPFSLILNPIPQICITPTNTILVIQDMQNFLCKDNYGIGIIASNKGIFTEFSEYYNNVDNIISKILSLKIFINDFKIPVFFTKWVFNNNTKYFNLQNALGIIPDKEQSDADIIGELKQNADDKIIYKAGLDVFTSDDFCNYLNERRIENIIYSGLITEYGIYSSALFTMSRGLRPLIVSDCCAGITQLSHESAIDSINYGLVKIRPLNELFINLDPLFNNDVALV